MRKDVEKRMEDRENEEIGGIWMGSVRMSEDKRSNKGREERGKGAEGIRGAGEMVEWMRGAEGNGD